MDNIAWLPPAPGSGVITTSRFRRRQGSSVLVAGRAWMRPLHDAFAPQGNRKAPTTVVHDEGVRADVCPGRRSWSPPV